MSKTASPLTYERSKRTLICVRRAGAFLCWLEQTSHRQATGLNRLRYTKWTAVVGGIEISAVTLTAAKTKIAAKVAA